MGRKVVAAPPRADLGRRPEMSTPRLPTGSSANGAWLYKVAPSAYSGWARRRCATGGATGGGARGPLKSKPSESRSQPRAPVRPGSARDHASIVH